MTTNGDALLWRDVEPGVSWAVLRVRADRIPAYLAEGWHVLLSSAACRDQDVADTFAEDTFQWHRYIDDPDAD